MVAGAIVLLACAPPVVQISVEQEDQVERATVLALPPSHELREILGYGPECMW
jgi:hypothetical protein